MTQQSTNWRIWNRQFARRHQQLTDLKKQAGGAKKGTKPTSGGGNGKSPKKKRQLDTNKQQCKTYGKTHAGKCWKLTGGPSKIGKFDQATLNMLKEYFAAKGDSDDESGSKPHWGKSLSDHEYSYVLATAQAETGISDNDISIDNKDLKEYRKKYKKTFKKKESHN